MLAWFWWLVSGSRSFVRSFSVCFSVVFLLENVLDHHDSRRYRVDDLSLNILPRTMSDGRGAWRDVSFLSSLVAVLQSCSLLLCRRTFRTLPCAMVCVCSSPVVDGMFVSCRHEGVEEGHSMPAKEGKSRGALREGRGGRGGWKARRQRKGGTVWAAAALGGDRRRARASR